MQIEANQSKKNKDEWVFLGYRLALAKLSSFSEKGQSFALLNILLPAPVSVNF